MDSGRQGGTAANDTGGRADQDMQTARALEALSTGDDALSRAAGRFRNRAKNARSALDSQPGASVARGGEDAR